MASVRVEGIMGHVLVAVEWRDGQVTGNPVLRRAVELAAGDNGRRFFDDPISFAAIASRAVERYSDAPARITTEGLVESLERGMTGLAA